MMSRMRTSYPAWNLITMASCWPLVTRAVASSSFRWVWRSFMQPLLNHQLNKTPNYSVILPQKPPIRDAANTMSIRHSNRTSPSSTTSSRWRLRRRSIRFGGCNRRTPCTFCSRPTTRRSSCGRSVSATSRSRATTRRRRTAWSGIHRMWRHCACPPWSRYRCWWRHRRVAPSPMHTPITSIQLALIRTRRPSCRPTTCASTSGTWRWLTRATTSSTSSQPTWRS